MIWADFDFLDGEDVKIVDESGDLDEEEKEKLEK
jgi:hypothetical protein